MSWKKKTQELETERIYQIIDDLARNGTRWISFTGGEPFLKKDIDKIINKAVSRKILISVNSSGFGVREHKAILKKIVNLHLSLDGPPEIHNFIRGEPDAYERVIEAASLAKETGVKIKFFAVINKLNINAIDFLLRKAKEFRCTVMFQPATPFKLRIHAPNPIALSQQEHAKVMEYLIRKKKQGYLIANSFCGLKCLQQKNLASSIKCWGGRVFFRIEPDGSFRICSLPKTEKQVNCAIEDIKTCINAFTNENKCRQCFSSARIEFNCIFSQKVEALLNFLKNREYVSNPA